VQVRQTKREEWGGMEGDSREGAGGAGEVGGEGGGIGGVRQRRDKQPAAWMVPGEAA